jgi:hypothetical protein
MTKNKDIPAFCLLKRVEYDAKDSVIFNKILNEINPYYTSIYVIEEKEARKLNLNYNPTRLYVSKQKIVTNIIFGVDIAGDLYEEIEQNINR